jgi:hypothetical protein
MVDFKLTTVVNCEHVYVFRNFSNRTPGLLVVALSPTLGQRSHEKLHGNHDQEILFMSTNHLSHIDGGTNLPCMSPNIFLSHNREGSPEIGQPEVVIARPGITSGLIPRAETTTNRTGI